MSQAAINSLTASKSSILGARTLKPAKSVFTMIFSHSSKVALHHPRAGANPVPSVYGLLRPIRRIVGTTLAVVLGRRGPTPNPYNSMPLHAHQLRAQFFSFIELLT